MTIIQNMNMPPAIPKDEAFPLTPIDGQVVRRADYMNEVFTFNQASNEWVGDRLRNFDYGNISTTGSGAALRYIGVTVGSAIAGLELDYRVRFFAASGNWNNAETGNFQLRRNGITQFNVPVANTNFFHTEFDENDPQYLVESANARTPLSVFWVGSTGSIIRPVVQLFGRRVLLPGE